MLLLIASLFCAPDEGVRQVVAAVHEAAKENAAKPRNERLAGDALLDLYVRRACASGQPARAVVLGLAYALDRSNLLARTPFLGDTFKGLESADERAARLAVQGAPTLRGREDWLAHFTLSAALTVLAGEQAAELFGVQKEVADAKGKEKGQGSGFSFSDLAADFAGIAFARWLSGEKSKEAIEACKKSFKGDDFLHDLKELKEGLTWTEFEKTYGGVMDARFREECQKLRRRVQDCKGYRQD